MSFYCSLELCAAAHSRESLQRLKHTLRSRFFLRGRRVCGGRTLALVVASNAPSARFDCAFHSGLLFFCFCLLVHLSIFIPLTERCEGSPLWRGRRSIRDSAAVRRAASAGGNTATANRGREVGRPSALGSRPRRAAPEGSANRLALPGKPSIRNTLWPLLPGCSCVLSHHLPDHI